MAKHIKLTPEQKDELRRLTQLANRRIKNAFKVYEKSGKSIVPKEIVGNTQIREQWHTKSTPLSRSVKFDTYQDYRRHLHYLRSFEVTKVGIKEYTEIQQMKVLHAVKSSLGVEVPIELRKKISKMDATQLTDFWNDFADKASKLGMQYASETAMMSALEDYFGEDIESFKLIG